MADNKARNPSRTEPEPLAGGARFVVARGEIHSGLRKARKVAKVGDRYRPADDAERDRLVATGQIVSAEDFFRKTGGAPAQAALDDANRRADELQAEVDRLRAQGAGGQQTQT